MATNVMLKKAKKREAPRTKFTPLTVFMLVVLSLYALSLFGLLFYGVMTSVKLGNPEDFNFRLEFEAAKAYKLPSKIYFNFDDVYHHFKVSTTDKITGVSGMANLVDMYGNTILYTLGCSLSNTIVICITAYGCARFPYKFSKLIHSVVIVVMIIPVIGNAPSELEMARAFGLYNQIWGMWIMRANFLGMYFLVFYDIFKSLPASYTEAAKIDGAGNWSILLRIMLPLIKNTFLTVLLINFITVWNDYQVPILYLPSYPTIAQGLYEALYGGMSTEGGMAYQPWRFTAAMLVMVPILIVFMCTQKRLLGNLTVGGVKG